MKTLNEIIQALQSVKQKLKDEYGVLSLELFGSYIRNEQKEDSDIDILVVFDEAKYPSYFGLIGIQNFLEDLLNANVDLIPKDSIKPRYKKYILNDTLTI